MSSLPLSLQFDKCDQKRKKIQQLYGNSNVESVPKKNHLIGQKLKNKNIGIDP